jgi:hypothetical protein
LTEAEWLAATDPSPMLAFVHASGRASFRKLWLFTAASCRCASSVLPAELVRAIARISELLATGKAPPEERQAVHVVARQWKEFLVAWRNFEAAALIREFENYFARPAQRSWDSARWAIQLARLPDWPYPEGGLLQETGAELPPRRQPAATITDRYRCLSNILRCLFSYSTANLDPAWLSWNGGAVPQIARSIDDDQAFDRMPLLADALEDAGCTDAEILGHCRGDGEHVRGCRVLELILTGN